MKTLVAGLQAHLDGGTTTLAWCWKVTRKDGAVYGFTDHDMPVTFASLTYGPDSGFAPAEIRSSDDLSVDAQDAVGVLNSSLITETDILDGRWDNAAIEVWRVNWADSAQRVMMRRGNIGEVRRGKLQFTAEVRSMAHYLNQPIGRTYQYSCDAALGDSRCTVSIAGAPFRLTGTVATLSGDRGFAAAALGSSEDGFFARGSVIWASGANAGRTMDVNDFIGGYVTLMEQPVRPMGIGDTFAIIAGCDKQFATCQAKFLNAVNFRGFPHMPGEEAVLRYAAQGKANAGTVL